MRCLWLPTFLSLFHLASAILVNTTVDDTNGGPSGSQIIYQPDNDWLQSAIGGCDNCSILPIRDIASMNTFHGSLFVQTNKFPPSVTLLFFGSSVSVNCILVNTLINPPGTSDLTFLIDGIQRGTFPHIPSGSQNFQLATVFISDPLDLSNHTLEIKNGRIGGPNSLMILDSITFGFDDLSDPTATQDSGGAASSTTSSPGPVAGASKGSNTAAIAGGVIAALAVILLLAVAFLYMRYRKNQHRSNVPISTTLSPLGWISSKWSRAQSPPRPPPDMAPVPFTAPVYAIAASSPVPRPRAPEPPSPQSRLSRISFNANLLVGRFQRRPPPSAIVTQQRPTAPPHAGLPVPVSPALLSGNPLLRSPSAQPHLQPEPNSVHASIQQWQRRTQEETANEPIPIIHPLDMSEVDLSSHYDESSISSPPPAPPPAPPPRSPHPPQRRFTVMNN
ncbi:hypothetical protein R3P38DRAFT_2826243 [Favolaschia claudopus]|uniref:Uncharacterized protein n=1 Tax=Favolaschia claudopus TaxID=2862362 RepID=A0AAW0EJ02_9AGAR